MQKNDKVEKLYQLYISRIFSIFQLLYKPVMFHLVWPFPVTSNQKLIHKMKRQKYNWLLLELETQDRRGMLRKCLKISFCMGAKEGRIHVSHLAVVTEKSKCTAWSLWLPTSFGTKSDLKLKAGTAAVVAEWIPAWPHVTPAQWAALRNAVRHVF